MKLTGKQVQSDILELFKSSSLPEMLSGGVYRNGYRPRDSKLEDAIVIFTTGLADQIQSGVVTLNIYVPDIDPYSNGVLVEDGRRCEEIETAAEEWVETLKTSVSNYKFTLQNTIYTEEETDINQHFVVIKLKYKYYE
jgi:hypothetical protein